MRTKPIQKPVMTPEERKKLQAYEREIAKILYQEASLETLESLADIEKTFAKGTPLCRI